MDVINTVFILKITAGRKIVMKVFKSELINKSLEHLEQVRETGLSLAIMDGGKLVLKIAFSSSPD